MAIKTMQYVQHSATNRIETHTKILQYNIRAAILSHPHKHELQYENTIQQNDHKP